MDERVPESTAIRIKEGTKGPESSKPHPPNQLVRMRSAVRIRPAAPLKALSPNGFKAFDFYKIPAPESFDYYLTTGAGFFCVSGVFLKDIFQSSDCLSISLLKCVCVDIERGGGLRVPHARGYGFNVQIAGD